MDADGDFVVAWRAPARTAAATASTPGASTRRASPRAASSGSTPTPRATRIVPAVAMDADGDFVVAWQSNGQDGSGYGVYAQRFNAAGVAQGGEFRVNTYTTEQPVLPRGGDGRRRRLRRRLEQQRPGRQRYGVFARRFNAAGVAQGGEFRVNTYTTGNQYSPAVAMDADGDFVVAWQSDGQDGERLRRLRPAVQRRRRRRRAASSASTPSPPATRRAPPWRWTPTATSSSPGRATGQDGSGYGVFARRFNAAGVAAGQRVPRQHLHHQPTSDPPPVAMDADGDFVVAWQSSVQDGSGYGVFAPAVRRRAASAQGGEFRVNTYTTERPVAPRRGDGRRRRLRRRLAEQLARTAPATASSRQRFAAARPPRHRRQRPARPLTDGLLAPALPVRLHRRALVTGAIDVGRLHAAVNATADRYATYRRTDAGSTSSQHRRFALGSEFQVNAYTTAASSDYPRRGDGRATATSSSPGRATARTATISGVFARRFDAAGVAHGRRVPGQRLHRRTASAPGRGDGRRRRLRRRLAAATLRTATATASSPGGSTPPASPQGGEFRVNTFTTGNQSYPRVAMDADGDFVVAWESDGQDGSGYGVFARRFNAAGVAQGAEFRVNTFTTERRRSPPAWRWTPTATSSSPGRATVRTAPATASSPAASTPRGVAAGRRVPGQHLHRRLSALPRGGDGRRRRLRRRLAERRPGRQRLRRLRPAVQRRRRRPGRRVPGQHLTTDAQCDPAVAMDADGDFVVAWQSAGQDGAGYGVFARRFNAAGRRPGGRVPRQHLHHEQPDCPRRGDGRRRRLRRRLGRATARTAPATASSPSASRPSPSSTSTATAAPARSPMVFSSCASCSASPPPPWSPALSTSTAARGATRPAIEAYLANLI